MEFVIGAKLSQRLLFVLEIDEGDGVEELGEGEEGVVGVGEEFVLLKFGVREGTGVGGGVGLKAAVVSMCRLVCCCCRDSYCRL